MRRNNDWSVFLLGIVQFLLVLLLGVGGYTASALGQGKADPPGRLFSGPPEHAAHGKYGVSAIAGDVDTEVLDRGSAKLELQLPDGSTVTLARDGLEKRGPGNLVWRGRVVSEPDSRAILTLKHGFVAGKISIGQELYEIRPHRGRKHVVEQLDPELFPGDIALPIDLPDTAANSSETTPTGFDPMFSTSQPEALEEIDVMVTYSPQARSSAGGEAQVEAQIQSAVDSMNTAFIDSEMVARVRLVHTQEVSHNDSGDIGADLDWASSDSTVASLRDQFGADMVAHIVENGGAYCGIAWVQRNPGPGFAGWAFSVTDRGCLGNSTFAHELGHNLGFEHNPENGGTPAEASYPWSFAHYEYNVFRTIMSYSNPCGSCPRQDYFSNPDIYYSGYPTGIDGARDNARTGDLTASIVADFRASVVDGPLRFAAIGDFGSGTQGEADVADLVSALSPDLVITAGDNRYGATTMDQVVGAYFCDYLTDVSPSGSNCPGGNSLVNAFFPSTGNHDYTDGGGISEYLNYFTLPGAGIETSGTSGSELYYDFVEGPVHFFVIDSEGAFRNAAEMTAQQNWLQAGLAASTTPWQVVYFHHAPYSSGSHGSDSRMQWPFAAWGADAVISGHDHTYERIQRDGIVYFVNGLGGKSTYSFGPAIPGSEFRYNAAYGALVADATDSTITFEFINVSGDTVDSFTLNGSTTPNTVDVFIAQSSDDVEEKTADGSMYIVSSDIELGDDPGTNGAQTVGLRFSNINIPQGATIETAHIEFVTDEIGSTVTNVEIRAQAADNAGPFSTANFDLTSRDTTSASVDWDIPAWSTLGELHQTPELSAVIQEVVSRSGWQSGNSIAFVVSGTGTRTAEAYDGDPALAALLHVEFNTDTPPLNTPPTAAFGYTCSHLDCNFIDQSSDSDGSVVNWLWDFGDGDTSTTQSPSHSFASVGTFTVTLTVTDDDSDSDSTNSSVAVTANTAPTAAFDYACSDLDCSFTDQSSDSDGSVISWVWDFGDGDTSTTRNPSHRYSSAGTYTVVLTVTDDDSDTDSTSDSVTANTAPDAVDDTALTNEDVAIVIQVLNGDSDADWDSLTVQSVSNPPNGSANITGYDVTYIPDPNFFGEDSFTYSISDGNGGTDTATVTVTVQPVNDPPTFTNEFIDGGSAEAGEPYAGSIAGTASDLDGNPVSYSVVSGPAWLAMSSDGTMSGIPSNGDAGLNYFTVQASDGTLADTAELRIDVAIPPPFVDQLANGQVLTWGSASGSYVNTHTDDDNVQSITEAVSNGKPTNRVSRLQFEWTFEVESGNAVTLFANVWGSASSDGDQFAFSYSTDGSFFVPAFTVDGTSGSGNFEAVPLPASAAGTVYVRVEDTDRAKGATAQDTVYVDQLFIRSESNVSGPLPASPTGLAAHAVSSSRIDLNWTDNSLDELGFSVERSLNGVSFSDIGSVAAGVTSFTDTGLASSTTFHYRVRAFNSAGDSGYSNVEQATTADSATPPPGLHIADLDGSAEVNSKRWDATVEAQVVDAGGAPVSNATVSGAWSIGGGGSCTTDSSGICRLTKTRIKASVPSLAFTVNDVMHSALPYVPGDNEDPDNDSNGTVINIDQP